MTKVDDCLNIGINNSEDIEPQILSDIMQGIVKITET